MQGVWLGCSWQLLPSTCQSTEWNLSIITSWQQTSGFAQTTHTWVFGLGCCPVSEDLTHDTTAAVSHERHKRNEKYVHVYYIYMYMWRCGPWDMVVGLMAMGWWLDLMSWEVFSNIINTVILWLHMPIDILGPLIPSHTFLPMYRGYFMAIHKQPPKGSLLTMQQGTETHSAVSRGTWVNALPSWSHSAASGCVHWTFFAFTVCKK